MAALVKIVLSPGFVIGLLLLLKSPAAFSAEHAGDVFSLNPWKLLIPLDDDGDGLADEVTMPTLRNFEDPEFFYLSKTGDSILFRAYCGDVRGGGVNFPCSQLQEVTKNSAVAASWGSNDGVIHNLSMTLAIHAAPTSNSQVVVAGIYEGGSGILTVVLQGKDLILNRAGLEPLVLAADYTLGTFFDLMIIIDQGRIRVLSATKKIGEWPLEKSDLQFRAGCEVFPNPGRGSAAEMFGEVELQKLYVTHKHD